MSYKLEGVDHGVYQIRDLITGILSPSFLIESCRVDYAGTTQDNEQVWRIMVVVPRSARQEDE